MFEAWTREQERVLRLLALIVVVVPSLMVVLTLRQWRLSALTEFTFDLSILNAAEKKTSDANNPKTKNKQPY